jgi:CRP/FNR family transcriptional regulator, anaerobic regulatory protein
MNLLQRQLAEHITEKLGVGASDELQLLFDRWKIGRTLKRDGILTAVGVPELNIYYIVQGAVKICYALDDQEVICEFGYQGESIFDPIAFFTGKQSGFYIQAIRNTKLVGISRNDLNEHFERFPATASRWQQKMHELLVNFAHREVDLLAGRMDLRYQRLLARKPQLMQHIPAKYIAQYLGMSAETFSRLQNS